MKNLVACTLYSGHYHLGVGALANSLYRSGYRGTLWVGWLGALPPWCIDRSEFEAAPGFVVRFVPLSDRSTVAHEKPALMLRVLELDPGADAVIFFDADVVIRGKWSFFELWIESGAALVIDYIYPVVPPNHPWRRQWRALAESVGLRESQRLDFYFGSAVLGFGRAHAEIAEMWRTLLDEYRARHSERPKDALKHGDRADAFYSLDQDLLNAAAMVSRVPLAPIGPEALDFAPGGYLMSHPLHDEKPWRCSFIWRALRGYPPSAADKAYWQYADRPIKLFSKITLRTRWLQLMLAAAIGRFYRRT